MIDEPAADDEIGDRRKQPGNRRIARRLDDAHVHLADEIARQPSEEEVERIAVSREADGEPPDLAIAQQISQHSDRAGLGFAFGCRAAFADIVALLAGELRVGARVAVDEPIGDKISEAENCGEAEAPAPAQRDDGDRHERNADDIGELRRGVEDRRRRRALAAWEPVARRLGVGGKSRSFRDAEQDARSENETEAGRESDNSRSDAPEERADAADGHHAEPVEHDADGNLKDGVGPEEGAEKQSQIGRRQAELLLQLRRRDRDVHAVEIVDENASSKKEADHPPPPSDDLRLRHGVSSILS